MVEVAEVQSEARPVDAFAGRRELGAERIGLSHYRMNPGRRVGFGHRHGKSEEIYVVLAGAGRFKLDDEIVEWEAGPDGLEVLAFGGRAKDDSERCSPGGGPTAAGFRPLRTWET